MTKKTSSKSSGRPPATGSAKTKIFKVSPGFSIGGYDGKRKHGGDEIELTKAQAEHFLKLKAIELELDFGDDDDEEGSDSAEKATVSNAAKTSDGPKAKSL